MERKLKMISSVLGVFVALTMGLLPVLRNFLPAGVAVFMLKAGVILFHSGDVSYTCVYVTES
jgi:hypothetical protein